MVCAQAQVSARTCLRSGARKTSQPTPCGNARAPGGEARGKGSPRQCYRTACRSLPGRCRDCGHRPEGTATHPEGRSATPPQYRSMWKRETHAGCDESLPEWLRTSYLKSRPSLLFCFAAAALGWSKAAFPSIQRAPREALRGEQNACSSARLRTGPALPPRRPH